MSQLLDRVVDELSKLPSVGERSALRLALHLLRQPQESVDALTKSISDFRGGVKYCCKCNNLSDSDLCPICSDKSRDTKTICVVETIKDVMTIEGTGQYNGLYHVLGGVISPMSGIAPSDLKIDLLVENIKSNGVVEVILALNSTVEAETTMFFISRKIKDLNIKVTNIARGIGFGDTLDYADEMTLVHALRNRTEI